MESAKAPAKRLQSHRRGDVKAVHMLLKLLQHPHRNGAWKVQSTKERMTASKQQPCGDCELSFPVGLHKKESK